MFTHIPVESPLESVRMMADRWSLVYIRVIMVFGSFSSIMSWFHGK